MQRRFFQHRLRVVQHLEGLWDFAFLGDVEPDTVDVAGLKFNEVAAVPGCFDATVRHAGRRGLVAYRRRVVLADAAPHRFVFDGVHHWCRVFLNNHHLGDHAGGFTRFAMDVRDHKPGEANLVLLVDNRINPARSPLHLDYYDWYHYGGIARGAELHRLGDLWIDAVRVVTEDFRVRRIRVEVDYTSPAAQPAAPLRITLDGVLILEESVIVAAGRHRLVRVLTVKQAKLWSPQTPNLHLLDVQLGGDDLCERIGVRQVTARGTDICINDEPQQLLGFCRHETHPQFGHAQPDQLLVGDVELLKDMACNFVRGAHYPQDPRFLDLCDEAGICVWCEGTGWQNTVEQLNDPGFIEAAALNVREMVAAAYNHPSVILWGVLNEGKSNDPAGRPGYARLLQEIRNLDGSRPVTYATCFPDNDTCLDLADVISVNTYPGWYVGEMDTIPAYLDKITEWLAAAGQSNKPLIISEIGAAAVYGCHDWNRQRWTEEYQAELLELVIRHLFMDRERVCGLSIWQFCDLRTTTAIPTALGRARGFNNKGVMDEYRRPKLAYQAVKKAFTQRRAVPSGANE